MKKTKYQAIIRFCFLGSMSVVSIILFPPNWTFSLKGIVFLFGFCLITAFLEILLPNIILLHRKMLLNIFDGIIITPIFEELIFRNLFLQIWIYSLSEIGSPNLSILTGIFFTACIFTILHFVFIQFDIRLFFHYLVYGTLFGLLFILSDRSVIITALFHSYSNLLVYLLKFRSKRQEHHLSRREML